MRLPGRWARDTLLVAAVLTALTVSACGAPAGLAAGQTVARVVGTVIFPRHSSVVAAMKSAADYYRLTYRLASGVRNGWSWSTYFQGDFALFRIGGDQKYFTDGLTWGQSNKWSLTIAELDPDSIKAGQTYYDLHQLDTSASLTAVDARMAADLKSLPTSAYWWADALFMGLPNWTRWTSRTGNISYLDKMDALYTWTRDQAAKYCSDAPLGGLYDPTEHLWFRDCHFIGQRDGSGQKVFWARGNGWVLAAMAQVLATLPSGDTHTNRYRDMLRSMAARLKDLQGADGFWRSSLLDPKLYPQPETSSTALFAYGMAYGVNAGLLDRATYLPVIARAWNGLATSAWRSTGFISYCQPVGAQPAAPYTGSGPRVAPTSNSAGTLHVDSPPFCVGAFLLAGSEVARLAWSMLTGVQSVPPFHRRQRSTAGQAPPRWREHSASGRPVRPAHRGQLGVSGFTRVAMHW